MLISIDAQKAFDSVRWKFLFKVMEKFGFNKRLIKTLQALYTKQEAIFNMNGGLSDSFQLERSTRQGYPQSPLLFSTVDQTKQPHYRSSIGGRWTENGSLCRWYPYLTDQRMDDINRWSLIPYLSIYSHIDSIKMNTLPRPSVYYSTLWSGINI